MNPELPPAAPPPVASLPQPPAPKRRRYLLFGCGGLLALFVIIIATIFITLWWLQRPIKPVVLTQPEKVVVEEKLQHLDRPLPVAEARTEIKPELKVPEPKGEPDRVYTPGSKTLKLTERELNGLLNENTDLGNTVRIELGRDAINAYIVTPIPEDVPIMGGKMFRARGRFRISISENSEPYAVLEDVTVFGLSLPKAWLGGIKGENLLKDAMGERKDGQPVLRGVKSLRVEPGAIVLEVED